MLEEDSSGAGWHWSRDLKKTRQQARQVSEVKAFQQREQPVQRS